MLKTAVDAGVPVLVVVAMVVVGMELTLDDFRRVARPPRLIGAAIVGQIVLLPVIGWLLARPLSHHLAIAQGVLLVTACPSGAMANVYTLLGRGNVALSVTLTAVSCLAAVLTTPLTLAVFAAQANELAGFSVPLGLLMGQLVILLVLPVLGGMAVRRRWPGVTRWHGRKLLGLGVGCLIILLLLVIVNEAEQFAQAFADLATAAGVTAAGFGAAWATGVIAGAALPDCLSVGMVFVVRNVGIATAIAVTSLGRVEFAVFATAYFLAQVPLLLATVGVIRSLGNGNQRKILGVDRP